MAEPGVRLIPVVGLGEVHEGDDLADLIVRAVAASGDSLRRGDVVVVSSKVVSKSLGLRADDRAAAVRASTRRVVVERSTRDGVTRVVEAVAGPVLAAGGVDASNTGGGSRVLVLPEDPDAAARNLRTALAVAADLPLATIGVVVTDTAGRAWRVGQTDFALGSAGVRGLDDLRGAVDADGRPLAVTARAVADEIAAAADLVKGKVSGIPVAVVRGMTEVVIAEQGSARELVRTGPGDWFALGHVEAVRAALGVEPGSSEAATVGIPPVDQDDVPARARRVVALALVGVDEAGVEADRTGAAADEAGEVGGPDWTDASVHDPGITELELLAYAVDDLSLGRLVARLEVAAHSEGLLARAGCRLVDGRLPVRLTTIRPGT